MAKAINWVVDLICGRPVVVENHITYVNFVRQPRMKYADELAWYDQCANRPL